MLLWSTMEILLMSLEERKRMVVLLQVKKKALKLVDAAELMGVSYRQAKRLAQRFRNEGDGGLVHRSRGRVSRRRKPAALRSQVLARYRERYGDFGPTLASEHLGKEGLQVDHETLRRWLSAEGIRPVRRRGQRHRARRERKSCFGELVQMDGCDHDWFEGRGPKAVLMVMIDDATNRTGASFFEGETTHASFDVFESWARRYGLPGALYVDRDSIYRAEGVLSVAEQLAGQQSPQTQFGRAMAQLGVRVVMANSPQAKGRVERRHGVFQDRLVKELRLAGINNMAGGNEYLAKQFLPEMNRRFTVEPVSAVDAHRAPQPAWAEALSWEYDRVVQRDWTVGWEGHCFQIEAGHEQLNLVGKKVKVRKRRDGGMVLLWAGLKLRWRELAQRPKPVVVRPRAAPKARIRPAANHPWRRSGR